jgi:hypothetical protein
MEWSKSYSAYWRVYRVNTKTWADGDRVNNIDSIQISRTADGKMLESGSMELSGDFEQGYYRIAMTAVQGDSVERIDIATLLFNENGGKFDYGTSFRSVDGSSVLYPASTAAVVVGEYAPAGVDGAKYAGDLLRSCINAPVEVEGSFTLNEHVVHELGSAVIEAVWAVLDAGNFTIQIDGRGVVHIRPQPTEPSLVLDSTQLRLLQNEISYSADSSEIPNRYIVIVDNNITIASNEDENSPVSIPARGYYVDLVDTSPTPINGETYGMYANRMLHKLSVLREEASYSREYAPNVYLGDIIRASISGMTGDYRIKLQTVERGNGVTVSETAYKETSLW